MHYVRPVRNGFEYEVWIRHDTLAEQYRTWFYFSIGPSEPHRRIVITIVNFSKQRSLYRDGGMTPIVRSRMHPHLGWQRIPPRNCFYYKASASGSSGSAAASGSGGYLLSFVFTFGPDEGDVYDFAYSFPFTYTRLQR